MPGGTQESIGLKTGSWTARLLAASTLTVAAFTLSGCGGSKPAPVEPPPVVENKPEVPVQAPPKEPEKPKPEVVWAELLKSTDELVEAGKFGEAEQAFAKFEKVFPEGEKPSEELASSLQSLKERHASKVEEHENAIRDEKLAAARTLLNEGKYEEATSAVNDVQKLAPTAAQREEASQLVAEVERRRVARRRLATWMKLLESSDKKEIRTAQTQLHKEAEVALPLLVEAAHSADNPTLVANTLELLRRLQRPASTLPVMLSVLSRESQEKNWPDAVREIGRANAPGIGPQLLELTLSSKSPAQRGAALAALAQVPDPPEDTFLRLLPRLYEDSVDLPAALQACAQAVRTHRQFDVVARRGIDGELTEVEERMLSELPARLDKIIARGSEAPAEIVDGAKILAVTTRQKAAAPLEGVKVLTFGGQVDDGKAAAVLDGVWNKLEYPTMWRHPIDRKGTIILDLGEERIVEGVRIWNFNETNGTHRGWKEVEVFVSSTETALTPVATGIVLPAPGLVDTPDYSSVIPVPSVRGRYVRLDAKSVWRPDTYMGLSEIQVLGY